MSDVVCTFKMKPASPKPLLKWNDHKTFTPRYLSVERWPLPPVMRREEQKCRGHYLDRICWTDLWERIIQCCGPGKEGSHSNTWPVAFCPGQWFTHCLKLAFPGNNYWRYCLAMWQISNHFQSLRLHGSVTFRPVNQELCEITLNKNTPHNERFSAGVPAFSNIFKLLKMIAIIRLQL